MIRQSANWMVSNDERILEFLRENGPTAASIMEACKGISGSTDEINNRCARLREAELIWGSSEENWRISPFGEIYLEGEFPADFESNTVDNMTEHLPEDHLPEILFDLSDENTTIHLDRNLLVDLFSSAAL